MKMRMFKRLSFLPIALSALLIAGCLGPLKPCFYVESVRLKVDSDANDSSATAVDLVVIYDETLMKEFLAMTAEQYFEKAEQLKRDYPQQIDVFRWEVVPGQILFSEDLYYQKSCPLGGLVFARYIAKGPHRVRVGHNEHIEIHLKNNSFCVRPLDGKDGLIKTG